ncbi:MAG: hypothetical protein K2Y04_03555 [Caulobacteraceae bacterium]|nr:hypothetical protein [Caulobacteraceae bacterium]
MPITSLPTPPSRTDAANFNARADAFLGALPTFATEANGHHRHWRSGLPQDRSRSHRLIPLAQATLSAPALISEKVQA